MRAAAGGRGGLVLVGGEAGIGKTTLIRALRLAPGGVPHTVRIESDTARPPAAG